MRFTKKPFEVEAMQWTGGNFKEVFDFIPNRVLKLDPEVLGLIVQPGAPNVPVPPGFWIIKDNGLLLACEDTFFRATHNPVKDRKPRKRKEDRQQLTDPPAGYCSEFDCPF
jgi:hypothetical protein